MPGLRRFLSLGIAVAFGAAFSMPALAQDAEQAEAPAAADTDEGPSLPQYTRFFYFQPFLGYSYVDGGALGGDDRNVPAAVRLESNGFSIGSGLGFKIFILQLGGRVTYAFHEDYNLGGVMGELGVRIPIPVFEPIVRLGAGYGWMNVKNTLGDLILDDPGGFLLDIGLGFDVWVGSNVTIGFDGAVGLYFLAREAIRCARTGEGCTVEENDNAGALQIRLQLTVGFWG